MAVINTAYKMNTTAATQKKHHGIGKAKPRVVITADDIPEDVKRIHTEECGLPIEGLVKAWNVWLNPKRK